MSPKVSLRDALLVIAFAVLAATWFFLPRGDQETEDFLATWSDLVDDAPTRIVFTRAGESVVLERRGDASTHSPYVATNRQQLPADPAVVDRIIHELSHLDVARLLATTDQNQGLERPTLDIELVNGHGTRRLRLGGAAASPNGARYAAVLREGHQRTLVLAAPSVQALDVPLDTLLERRVFDWVPSELRSLEVTSGSGSFRLTRRDDGHFMLMDEASAQRARRDSAQALTLALTELTLTRFLDEASATRQLGDHADVDVALTASREAHESSMHLRLGGHCPNGSSTMPEVVLILDGAKRLAGCTDAKRSSQLSIARSAFIDDGLFSLHPDEVERLDFASPKFHFALDRKGSAFELKSEPPQVVPLLAGNHLLESLSTIHGELTGRCEFTIDSASSTLALRSNVVSDEHPTHERISWLESNAGGSRSVCRDDGVALRVNAGTVGLLELDPGTLRDPTLVDLPAESVQKVTLVSNAGRQVLQSDVDGRFALIEPKGAEGDAATIESLRERLAQLRVSRFLPNLDPASATLQPLASLDWTLGADATRHRLRVFTDPDDRVLAWFDAETTGFSLDDGWRELIDGWLLDRSTLRLRDADAQVTLLRGPDQIRLQRAEGNGTPTWRAESAGRSASTIDEAVATLTKLRAVSVQPLPNADLRLAASARSTSLSVEYSLAGVTRLRFDVGAPLSWHKTSVRVAKLRGTRYALLLRDDDLAPIFALFGAR